jgi:hypothetical protein
MNSITKLFIFDFDETLFRMPGYTDRFSVERLHPELEFPDPYSFYDHPKSMCPETHNIQLILPVYEDWKAAHESPSSKTILITHRTEELRPDAQRLLDLHKITFDESHFLGRVSEKYEILKENLERHPNVDEIIVYEDSLEQLIKYESFFYDEYIAKLTKRVMSLRDLPTLTMQFVDKSKLISLYSITPLESRRIKLI